MIKNLLQICTGMINYKTNIVITMIDGEKNSCLY